MAAAVPTTVDTTVATRATTTELRSELSSGSLANMASYHLRENPPQVPTLRSPENEKRTRTAIGAYRNGEHHPPIHGQQAIDPPTGGSALGGGHSVFPPLRK